MKALVKLLHLIFFKNNKNYDDCCNSKCSIVDTCSLIKNVNLQMNSAFNPKFHRGILFSLLANIYMSYIKSTVFEFSLVAE